MEVIEPDKIQDINITKVDRFKLDENRKNVIPKQIIIKEGFFSLGIPFQYFL